MHDFWFFVFEIEWFIDFFEITYLLKDILDSFLFWLKSSFIFSQINHMIGKIFFNSCISEVRMKSSCELLSEKVGFP